MPSNVVFRFKCQCVFLDEQLTSKDFNARVQIDAQYVLLQNA